MSHTSSYTELKERLVQCGFNDNTLNELLKESIQWPTTAEHFLRFVTVAFERQPEPSLDLRVGDHVMRMHRSWRPKLETSEVIKRFLGVGDADFAKIRLLWVLENEGKTLLNPDFVFLHQVQAGLAETNPLTDPIKPVHVEAEWWESEYVRLDDAELPDEPPPIVEELSAQFSVNLRTFNLHTYIPRERTVRWLTREHCIPKSFIFNRPMVLDSFVGYINQQWLPRGTQPSERWRFVERQFCNWVLERFPKFCDLDDGTAFQHTVAKYAKTFNLTGELLSSHLENTLGRQISIRQAVELLQAKIRAAEATEHPAADRDK